MVNLNSVEGIESLIDKRTNPLKKQIKELKNLVNELKEAINFTDSSLLLKEKEALTFEDYIKQFNERAIDGELFYETDKGLKSIEEIDHMYYVYTNL